jgi:hypothetical protein
MFITQILYGVEFAYILQRTTSLELKRITEHGGRVWWRYRKKNCIVLNACIDYLNVCMQHNVYGELNACTEHKVYSYLNAYIEHRGYMEFDSCIYYMFIPRFECVYRAQCLYRV